MREDVFFLRDSATISISQSIADPGYCPYPKSVDAINSVMCFGSDARMIFAAWRCTVTHERLIWQRKTILACRCRVQVKSSFINAWLMLCTAVVSNRVAISAQENIISVCSSFFRAWARIVQISAESRMICSIRNKRINTRVFSTLANLYKYYAAVEETLALRRGIRCIFSRFRDRLRLCNLVGSILLSSCRKKFFAWKLLFKGFAQFRNMCSKLLVHCFRQTKALNDTHSKRADTFVVRRFFSQWKVREARLVWLGYGESMVTERSKKHKLSNVFQMFRYIYGKIISFRRRWRLKYFIMALQESLLHRRRFLRLSNFCIKRVQKRLLHSVILGIQKMGTTALMRKRLIGVELSKYICAWKSVVMSTKNEQRMDKTADDHRVTKWMRTFFSYWHDFVVRFKFHSVVGANSMRRKRIFRGVLTQWILARPRLQNDKAHITQAVRAREVHTLQKCLKEWKSFVYRRRSDNWDILLRTRLHAFRKLVSNLREYANQTQKLHARKVAVKKILPRYFFQRIVYAFELNRSQQRIRESRRKKYACVFFRRMHALVDAKWIPTKLKFFHKWIAFLATSVRLNLATLSISKRIYAKRKAHTLCTWRMCMKENVLRRERKKCVSRVWFSYVLNRRRRKEEALLEWRKLHRRSKVQVRNACNMSVGNKKVFRWWTIWINKYEQSRKICCKDSKPDDALCMTVIVDKTPNDHKLEVIHSKISKIREKLNRIQNCSQNVIESVL